MKLKSLLDKEFINVQVKVTTKEEAIDLILKQFSHRVKFKESIAAIRQAILEREKLGGTLLEGGMAIPHARLEGFNDLLTGIVIPETPIREPEGEEIRCLVIFLTTKGGSTHYLQTLASFARIAAEHERYNKFLASSSANELISSIEDIVIEKGMTVKDIMSETVYSLTPKATLKELADLFYQYRISYVPVVDEENNLLGEVTMGDLLKVGIPNYAVMIGNLDFLSHFEPFEELLNNEDKIIVEHIMREAKETLTLETSIIKTTMLMTKHNRRHLPVVEQGKILGVVSYMDLLSKVLRA